jgi:hypothetical protein
VELEIEVHRIAEHPEKPSLQESVGLHGPCSGAVEKPALLARKWPQFPGVGRAAVGREPGQGSLSEEGRKGVEPRHGITRAARTLHRPGIDAVLASAIGPVARDRIAVIRGVQLQSQSPLAQMVQALHRNRLRPG